MEINKDEISSVEDIGTMKGSPVKLCRTRGGWFFAATTKGMLAAGSHPAIVKYNLERQYPEFQPSMMKSEFMAENTNVEKHSHFLSDDLRKSGHDIYSVQSGPTLEFYVTKQNATVHKIDALIQKDVLVLNGMEINKQFSRGLAGAATEKSLSLGANKIRIESK